LRSGVGGAETDPSPRPGIAGRAGGPDVVEGIVPMRRGGKTPEVVDRIAAEVRRINSSGDLPAGVRLVPFYDRRDLIRVTTHTVFHNLLLGVALIFLLQWIFLGDLRSAVIVGATIPVALLFAFMILIIRGDSANLLSVGAIDFGIIVDATVIMVESIFRHLREPSLEPNPGVTHTESTSGAHQNEKARRILRGAAEVSRPI